MKRLGSPPAEHLADATLAFKSASALFHKAASAARKGDCRMALALADNGARRHAVGQYAATATGRDPAVAHSMMATGWHSKFRQQFERHCAVTRKSRR